MVYKSIHDLSHCGSDNGQGCAVSKQKPHEKLILSATHTQKLLMYLALTFRHISNGFRAIFVYTGLQADEQLSPHVHTNKPCESAAHHCLSLHFKVILGLLSSHEAAKNAFSGDLCF